MIGCVENAGLNDHEDLKRLFDQGVFKVVDIQIRWIRIQIFSLCYEGLAGFQDDHAAKKPGRMPKFMRLRFLVALMIGYTVAVLEVEKGQSSSAILLGLHDISKGLCEMVADLSDPGWCQCGRFSSFFGGRGDFPSSFLSFLNCSVVYHAVYQSFANHAATSASKTFQSSGIIS